MGNQKTGFLFSLLITAALSISAEAKNGFYPTHFFSSRAPLTSGATISKSEKALYYGGPVIGNVNVYAVFWGPKVNEDTQTRIGGFYSAVTNSSYIDWLKEYNTDLNAMNGQAGTNQRIGRGHFYGGITITPLNKKTTVTDMDIQTELQAQIDAGKLPQPDADTLFMVYFPPGVNISAGGQSCKDFCAYHSFKGEVNTAHFYYGVMPDIGGACFFGCMAGSSEFNSVTSISSHEMIESITDPFPTAGSDPAYPQAWNDKQGNELADICDSGSGTLTAGNASYNVQSIWDNATNSCTSQNWSSP